MNSKTQQLIDYREAEGLSQSFLKSQVVNESTKEFKGSVAAMCGSLTDTKLCVPECVEDLYHISTIEKYPTEQPKYVWDTFYNWLIETNGTLEIDNLALLDIYRAKYPNNYKDDTVLNKIMTGENYWNDLVNSFGKVVVSKEYDDKCTMVANSLRTHESTWRFFNQQDGIEIQYQVPLFWEYEDPMDGWSYNCKGLLDILVIDHNNKTIQNADVKTTGDSLKTWKKKIARKHRPDFQLSYYDYGVKQWAKKHYPDYTVINPCLIVENVDYPGKPIVYNLTDLDLSIGRYGAKKLISEILDNEELPDIFEFTLNEVIEIHGWQQAIEKYYKCQELGLPDFNLNYAQNKGVEDFNLWL